MLRTLKTTFVLCAALMTPLSACSSWRPIAYTPSPTTVADPREDFERLVMSAKEWRPTRIDMHDTFASLIYAGNDLPHGVLTVTVPFHEIDKVTILVKGDEYAVRATDSRGKVIYEYLAMNEKYARNFADVLTSLALTGKLSDQKNWTGELRRD